MPELPTHESHPDVHNLDPLASVDLSSLPLNSQRMLRGELYHAFHPTLIAERNRSAEAQMRLNEYKGSSRRERVRLWRAITEDNRPLPPELPNLEEDEAQFAPLDPYILPPFSADFGTHPHLQIAPTAFINAHCYFVDTCPIVIGARTLVGPNCHFYSGTHPLDPEIRRGIEGPEMGKAIVIGEDCWLAGRVTVLAGVKIGWGAVVGAGSVVSRDVESCTVVVGTPARFVRRIERGSMVRAGKISDVEKSGGRGS